MGIEPTGVFGIPPCEISRNLCPNDCGPRANGGLHHLQVLLRDHSLGTGRSLRFSLLCANRKVTRMIDWEPYCVDNLLRRHSPRSINNHRALTGIKHCRLNTMPSRSPVDHRINPPIQIVQHMRSSRGTRMPKPVRAGGSHRYPSSPNQFLA